MYILCYFEAFVVFKANFSVKIWCDSIRNEWIQLHRYVYVVKWMYEYLLLKSI